MMLNVQSLSVSQVMFYHGLLKCVTQEIKLYGHISLIFLYIMPNVPFIVLQTVYLVKIASEEIVIQLVKSKR